MSTDVCACALPLHPSVRPMYALDTRIALIHVLSSIILLNAPSCRPLPPSHPPTHPNSITYASRLDVQGEVPRALGVRKFGQIHPRSLVAERGLARDDLGGGCCEGLEEEEHRAGRGHQRQAAAAGATRGRHGWRGVRVVLADVCSTLLWDLLCVSSPRPTWNRWRPVCACCYVCVGHW